MSNDIISLLPPTRNRPYEMTRMVTTALDTARDPANIEIVFYIDDDDELSLENFEYLHGIYRCNLRSVVGKRNAVIASDMHNKCYEKCSGNIVAFMGDDVVFHTEGWDSLVRKTFEKCPDKIALVYPDDGINHEKLGVHGFLHRNWVDCVGYVTPPYFSAHFADTWVNEVAHNLGRRHYLPEFYLEHCHYSVGKGPLDETMQQKNNRHDRDNMSQLWYDTLGKRVEDTRKLLKITDPTNDLKLYERLV